MATDGGLVAHTLDEQRDINALPRNKIIDHGRDVRQYC
jgi:hypothetical protein